MTPPKRNNQKTSSSAKAGPQWVPLAEAAERAGVNPSTLRNWARNGKVESRTANGSGGPRRLVRLEEVVARASGDSAPGPVRGGGGDPSTDGAKKRSKSIEEDLGAQLVPVMKALPDMIRELAEARERAGRAEAKVEFLSDQLAELRSRREESGTARGALEQENRILEQRLARLQTQAEQMARRLAAAEQMRPATSDDVEEVGVASMTPEEEDEYLALTQRWRARRKRKREARKEARLQRRLDRES